MRAFIGRAGVTLGSRRVHEGALLLLCAALACACGGKSQYGSGEPDGAVAGGDGGGGGAGGVVTDASLSPSDGGTDSAASFDATSTADAGDTGAPSQDAAPSGTPPAGVISRSNLTAFEADGVVAVAPDGTTAVAWLADPDAENPSVAVIGTTFWTPGAAAWTAVQTMSAGTNHYVGDPTITVDGLGNFYVGWLELTNGATGMPGAVPHVWVASAPAGTTAFGAPVAVSDPTLDSTASLDDRPWLSVTDEGTVLVSYNTILDDAEGNTTGSTLFVARSTDQGATWTRTAVPSTGFTAFLCAPKTGGRTYVVDIEGGQGFDPDAGDAGGPTILGVHWSDDDGVTWPGSNLSIVASGRVEAPSCVATDSDVWVAYGNSTDTTLGYLDESVHVARLSDQGTRIVADVNATANEASPLFYEYQLGFGPNGRLDLFYYAGQADGDLNASFRHSDSTDVGTTWTASDEVYSPVLLTNQRHEKLWLGDWIGIADRGNTVYTTFVENELPDGVSHVAFETIPEPPSPPDAGPAPPLDAGAAPSGTQIVQSMTAALAGVTTNGYAVYTDQSDLSANVVPLTGASPTKIGGITQTGYAEAAGTTAFVFASPDYTTSGSPLTVWTAAHGAATVGDGNVYAGYVGAGGQLATSADGSELLFLENVTATTADLAVSGIDGTGTKVLVPGVRLDVAGCFPSLAFGGQTAVAQYCTSPTPANASYPATLSIFSGPSWTAATVSTASADGTAVDSTGTRLSFTDATGMEVALVATGAATLIDANGSFGLFTSDGSHLVYATASGGVSIAPSDASAAPTVLQASGGFGGLLALSPNDAWALAYKTFAQVGDGYATDLYLVPAATAGSVTTLASSATAIVPGSPFTTDSSYALFLSSVGASGVIPTGTFSMAPTAGGALQSYASGSVTILAGAGGAALFGANAGSESLASFSSADIDLVAPGSTAATTLVTQADSPFYLSPSLGAVVYSWSNLPSANGGIWVEEIP